jgi:indoleamine 2,3-dioxygenase
MREYLLDMRDYVPPAHLSFLLRLEAHRPLVRDVVKKRGLLRAAYNDAIKALANFRALHLHAADTYIRKPAPTELLGTGGSDFRVYLRKHREETKMHAISLKSTDLGLREGSKMAIEPQYKEEM